MNQPEPDAPEWTEHDRLDLLLRQCLERVPEEFHVCVIIGAPYGSDGPVSTGSRGFTIQDIRRVFLLFLQDTEAELYQSRDGGR